MTTDADLRHAIEVVAMQVISHQLEETGSLWEDYPEIGEEDWGRVAERVTALTAGFDVSAADYHAAYDLLEARAAEPPLLMYANSCAGCGDAGCRVCEGPR